MTSVAEQADPSPGPALHGTADHERPFKRHVDVADDGVDVGMPAAIVVGEFRGRAGHRPGFDLPIVALDEADVVHQLAAAPDSAAHVRWARASWCRASARDGGRRSITRAAPCHAAGELGDRARTNILGSSSDAVGTDHEGGVRRFAGVEADLDLLVGLADADAAFAEPDRVRLDAPDGVGKQPGLAMQHEVWRAVAVGGGGAELEPAPGLARAPMADLRPEGRTWTRRRSSSSPSA